MGLPRVSVRHLLARRHRPLRHPLPLAAARLPLAGGPAPPIRAPIPGRQSQPNSTSPACSTMKCRHRKKSWPSLPSPLLSRRARCSNTGIPPKPIASLTPSRWPDPWADAALYDVRTQVARATHPRPALAYSPRRIPASGISRKSACSPVRTASATARGPSRLPRTPGSCPSPSTTTWPRAGAPGNPCAPA